MVDRKPRIAFLGTGGTISFTGRDSLDTWEYMDYGERQSVTEILARFPEVEANAEIIPFNVRQVSSSGIVPDDWLALAAKIREVDATRDDIDGIVVTHGTATLEETAYFLNLTAKTNLPVVVIGAQRPSTGFATDAGSNLLAAVRTAGSAEARGLGVVVLLNEEIQAAREVTKTSTLRLETFKTPDLGMLGYADPDGSVAIYRKPVRPHTTASEFDVSDVDVLPRVDIVPSYAGADGTAIEAFIAAGAKALVMATLAPGLPTPPQVEAVEAAREAGIIIIYSTRAGSGRVLRRATMKRDGIVAADNLNPQKARVLAMLALTRTEDPDEIQRMFDTY
ncbi:MAG: asparaginase [Alphaproteobacteria bacterium]|jgi:L-asparaginase|nr:asparaginase [Alphaproteobacteria bacterium]